jgi:hypothetical protein
VGSERWLVHRYSDLVLVGCPLVVEPEKRGTQGDSMMNDSPVRTITVRWRKLSATLPAFALILGGIALDAQATPAPHAEAAVSKDSGAIVVPDIAVTNRLVPYRISAGVDAAAIGTPALALPAGVAPGGSSPVALDRAGIPVRALAGYRRAVALVDPVDPGCHVDWALLAAIGRVESDHGRFGGNQLDSGDVARPGIIGIALDGTNGTARITDTDGGVMDRDTVFDRAVGPMQFLPGTWRAVGPDADGDGVKNPQDMADAATAAAIYLCSGHGDLSQPAGLSSAIMRYNASDSYVRTVTAIADAYRHGVTALPASDLPASGPPDARSGSSVAVGVVRPARAAPARAGATPASVLRPPPAAATSGPTVTPSAPTAGTPGSAGTSPTEAAPSPTALPLPVPSDPCPVLPSPTGTATATPGTTVPDPAAPCPLPTTSSPTMVPTPVP